METKKLKLIYRGGYIADNIPGDKEPNAKEVDVVGTLLARDWKGLSTYGSNTVIEVYEIE